MKVRITSPKGKLRGVFTVQFKKDCTLYFKEQLPITVKVGDLIKVVERKGK